MADKELEAWYVERLRNLWPKFPPGPVSRSENPDTLVETPHGTVGIEVTTFTLDPDDGQQPIRESQSIRRRIIARARDIYRGQGGPVILVDIEFDDNVRLSKGDVNEVATAIAQRLLQSSFSEDTSPGWYQQIAGPMPMGVLAISGGRYRFAESWDGGSGYLIRDCSPAHVQRVIAKKAERYEAYRSQCSAVVLLIVFSSEHDPRIDVPHAVLEHTYSSPFDATVALLDDIPLAVELNAI